MIAPVIETGRLFLRRPSPRDMDCAMTGLARGAVASAPLAGPGAWRQMPTLLTHWELHGHGPFAVVLAGTDVPLGLAGPWHPSGWPEPEIGWLIWRRADDVVDLAAEAVAATCGYAADTLGWREAASFVSPGDPRALAVAELTGALADPFADRAGAIAFRHPLEPRSPLPRAA